MSAYVIDVNVGIVANQQARAQTGLANQECVLACIDALQNVIESGVLVIDDGWRILSEYQKHLTTHHQPGAGSLFMQWVWQNQSVSQRCEQVELAPLPNDPEDFEEFPNDHALSRFDRNDRKYVAVAKASKHNPEILNAVDTDWWEHRIALQNNGLTVSFLCPQHME